MKHDKLVKPRKLTPEQEKDLIAFYLAGWKTKQLAEYYSISQLTVQRYLHRQHVEMRPHYEEYRKHSPEVALLKHREKQKEWRLNNPERVAATKETHKADGRALRNKRKSNYKRYGLTPESYDQLVDQQNGLCPICSLPLGNDGRTPHIDHCHTTGKVRGIVHNKCNVLIGYADEKIEVLQGAIEYLRKHQDL